jgi:hypothetical protein
MTRHLGLIVTDASPLITLAAGEALECLTMPGIAVIIPDMVYAEVTEDLARLGAVEVVRWAREHRRLVTIAPTEVFAEFQALRTINPNVRSRGRGEQAALEVLNAETTETEGIEAVLLFEDADVRSRRFVRALPEHVAALSTGDLLRELEAAGRIQSADHVLDVAAEKERNVLAQRTSQSAEDAKLLLRRHLAAPQSGGETA